MNNQMQTFDERMAETLRAMKWCPFCGASGCKPANIVVDDSSVNDFSIVFCVECGARGPKAECWESASARWNERRDRQMEEMAAELRNARRMMNSK